MPGGRVQRTYWGLVTVEADDPWNLNQEIRRRLGEYVKPERWVPSLFGPDKNKGGMGLVADGPQITADGRTAHITLWKEEWVDCGDCVDAAAEVRKLKNDLAAVTERAKGEITKASGMVAQANGEIVKGNARIEELREEVARLQETLQQKSNETTRMRAEVDQLSGLSAHWKKAFEEQQRNFEELRDFPVDKIDLVGGCDWWDGKVFHYALPKGELLETGPAPYRVLESEPEPDSAVEVASGENSESTEHAQLRREFRERYGQLLDSLAEPDWFWQAMRTSGLYSVSLSDVQNTNGTRTLLASIAVPQLHSVTVREHGLILCFASPDGVVSDDWAASIPRLRAALDAPSLTVHPAISTGHVPENIESFVVALNDRALSE
jgi:hypothetical protein